MKIVVLIIFICLAYWIYYTNTHIEVSYFEIKNENIPKDFDDFKIVQISDLQNNNWNGLIEKLIEKEKTDAIFITGDLLDCYNTNFEVAKRLIKNLKQFKIFFVSGNHEARIKDYNDFEKYLVEKGVVVLNNKVFEIYRKDSKINILGITDPLFISKKFQDKIVEENLSKLNCDNNFSILLSHRPEHFNLYAKNKIDIAFCGHAHGGQIIIPFVKKGLIAPNQGLFPKYTDGVYRKEKTTMVVSRGLGNSGYRYRINSKPQLVVVKFKKL